MDTTSLKPTRLCCVCDKPLYGRSDKVFCDIGCKNAYHSDVRKHTKSASAVNIKILRKNYIILCGLLGSPCDKYVIKKLKLKDLGFNFDVISGISKTPYGLKIRHLRVFVVLFPQRQYHDHAGQIANQDFAFHVQKMGKTYEAFADGDSGRECRLVGFISYLRKHAKADFYSIFHFLADQMCSQEFE